MKKNGVRIISFIIVAVLVISLFSSVAAMLAYAANEPQPSVITGSVIIPGTIRQMLSGRADSQRIDIRFQFRINKDVTGIAGSDRSFALSAGSSFDDYYDAANANQTTRLSIEEKQEIGSFRVYEATLSYISYNGGTDRVLEIEEVPAKYNGTDYTLAFSVPIPVKYIRGPSSSTSDTEDTEEPPTSDIVVDSVIVKDSSGKQLDKIDKDTPPFSVEITYYDVGLAEVGRYILNDAKLSAFIASAAGFKPLGGASGEVKLVSSTGKYPKYRIIFKNVQCDGTSSTLGFRVQYDIAEYTSSIKGESTAVLHQVTTAKEEEETTPLIPKVIISEYSYGKESVVAGEEFNLDISFRNTSNAVGVENIDMTITPNSGFAITSASNTAYFTDLAAGEAKAFSIALKANPAGESFTASDYSIEIKFAYQYLSDKKYADGGSSVKISIPVTQLDRFGVDEITDYSQYLGLGEEGYVTVPITNKGKSTTYNITAFVRNSSGADFVAAPVHFENLAAGKSGTIDLSININTPGVFEGEAVVTYEDENMNQKELSVPFSIMVMEPAPPNTQTPPDMQGGEVTPEGPGLPSIILCAAGALLMAVPMSLYIIKRVKAKGIEDLDEDF